MTTLLEGYFRNTTTGAGVNAGTATAKKHSDGTTIATATTAGAGADTGNYEFTEADIGYPGQVYIEETKDSTTRVRSSKTNGIIGPFRPNDFTRLVRALGDGILSAIGNGFAVTASGSDLVLTVDTGFALGAGQTYYQAATQTVTVSAADASNPRIDRVVIRFYPLDTTDEDDVGRVDVVVLKGTAAATPVAPTLTQSLTTYWEIPLASVAVANGATTLSSGNLTDERTFVPFFPASGTDGQYLTLSSGEPAWDDFTSADVSDFNEAVQDQIGAHVKAGSGIEVAYDDTTGNTTVAATGTGAATITVQNGDSTVDADVSTLDFDSSDFAVTSNPPGEANISLNYGTSSGTPAEGSHGHNSFQNFEVNAARDSPTSGAVNVTSTGGATILSDTMTLSNGVTYDLYVWGHAQLNAPSGSYIWAAIDVSGTGISWSPVWLGTGTVGGERGVMPYAVVRNVTGSGQTVTVSLKAKVGSGTGSVSTASFLGQAIARGVGGAT